MSKIRINNIVPETAPGLGIGATSTDTSAILNITSTTQGVLFPRLTSTQRDAISLPTEGLTIYNTTNHRIEVYRSGLWGSNFDALQNASQSDATLLATSSTAYTTLQGASITLGSGVFLINFDGSFTHSKNGGIVYLSYFLNGTQITASEQPDTFVLNTIRSISKDLLVTASAGQIIEIKWKVNNGTGSSVIRSMRYVRIG